MSTDHTKRALLTAIEKQRAKVEAAEDGLAEARARLADLERQLTQVEPARPGSATAPLMSEVQRSAPVSAEEKIALFRSLFAGREDVFPRMWENKRTGKKGYAPACENEWVRGVCGKPKIKCGECPNRAFSPVTDDVIADHLRGKHVIGVYPMLADETCRLLAADFDGASWREDVAAFVDTCRGMSLYL